MPFKPYIPLLEPLRLPSADGSKVYEIPPISMSAGARLRLSLDPKSDVTLTAVEEQELLLGAVRARLLDDGVTEEYFGRVVLTVYTDWSRGRETAEIIWETGGDPKAIEALAQRPESLRSTSTGEGNETPSPASTSTTTSSPPTTKRSGTARKSRGTSSSKSTGS